MTARIRTSICRRQKIIHDETPGVDGDANDVAPSAALDTLFSAVTNIIQDPDVPHPGGEPAIGYAVGSGAIVTVTPNFGADGPGTVVYAIDVPGITPSSTTGVSSGLFTTDGHEIFLFEINSHLVVGRYDGSDAGTRSAPTIRRPLRSTSIRTPA